MSPAAKDKNGDSLRSEDRLRILDLSSLDTFV
jgi:hypothetical protein